MTQRYEHKSTEERPYDDTDGVDPYAPQMDGWELCGVTFRPTARDYYPGLRIFYWKRPVVSIQEEPAYDWDGGADHNGYGSGP